ncbi:DUF4198 domain-containing protein [Desulfotignum balticum]|jgi:uncharacterized GH25 family protein|uniref:DUF4198 domain-containing protein n=1 Tax=Desulfotignum balticum TaxID=115781 RepID=UPI00040BDE18|nr:DUF4198 domain-containing protein [Desulfotignum balticum]
MKKVLCGLFLAIGMATSAQAHSLWINVFESHAHQPPHALVSLGWGHVLPMDDILNSPGGRIGLEQFELIDPALAKTGLIRPEPDSGEPVQTSGGFDLFAGDMALQKVALKKGAANGVYQFSAASVPSFFTQYIDQAGKPRMQMKPRNEISGIKEVLVSVKYQAFAKSFLTVGGWQDPEPLGHDLEIIPRTDLSSLRAGDLVEVTVLFHGKPLTATAKSIEYITAHSSSFGQSEGFSLFSYIIDGNAQFRVQSSGQWMISVSHKDDVTPDGPLKDLIGKADQVYQGASLTFTVK